MKNKRTLSEVDKNWLEGLVGEQIAKELINHIENNLFEFDGGDLETTEALAEQKARDDLAWLARRGTLREQ
jgi:tyrosine-protein phosphatase YwqE